MHEFPAALLAHRSTNQRTVAWLAKKAELSQSHLSNLELGLRAPSPEHALALAKALGLTTAERRQFLVLAGLAHVPHGLREIVAEVVEKVTSDLIEPQLTKS